VSVYPDFAFFRIYSSMYSIFFAFGVFVDDEALRTLALCKCVRLFLRYAITVCQSAVA